MRPRSPAASSRSPALARAITDTRSTRFTTVSGTNSARARPGVAAHAAPSAAATNRRPNRLSNLLAAHPAKRVRLEVAELAAHAEDRRRLVLEAREGERVGAGVEVVERHPRIPRHARVVVLHRVRFLEAPQLAARIVEIGCGELERVLVEVHDALREHVALAFLEVALGDPDAAQLVAQELRVHVPGPQHVRRLQALVGELVDVGRYVHFLLADELPRVAVGGAVPRVVLVGEAQALGAVGAEIAAKLRNAAHAALARVVEPAAARFLALVDRVPDEEDRSLEGRGHAVVAH